MRFFLSGGDSRFFTLSGCFSDELLEDLSQSSSSSESLRPSSWAFAGAFAASAAAAFLRAIDSLARPSSSPQIFWTT